MKRALLCLFYVLAASALSSQTIDLSISCLATDPVELTLVGDDGNGRNIYEGPDGANTIRIAFDNDRWEILLIDDPDPGMEPTMIVMAYSEFASTPNPPDDATGGYVATGNPLTCNVTSLTSDDGGTQTDLGCTTPAVITSLTTNQPTYCPGEPIILTVNGSLNDADEWVVYNNNGCGVTEVISSATGTINIGSRANPGSYTIYVRGEGACLTDPGDCTELVIEVATVEITCPNIASPAIVGPNCTSALSDYTISAGTIVTDNCLSGSDVNTITQYPAPGTPLGPGTYPITLTVLDEEGFGRSCTFSLEVQDNTVPTASDIAHIYVQCVEEVPDPDPELVTDEMDNCADCPETVWVNEFHYENANTDLNEFVEIAGTAGTDLNAYSLVFYNGINGQEYVRLLLAGTIDDESNGFGAVSFPLAGIMNGNPDGFALVKDGSSVLEFWSYGGTFIPVEVPAQGMQSTDVGFTESASSGDPNGSIQRTGTGNVGPDFLWTAPATASPGDLNVGQSLTICGLRVTFDGEVNQGGTGANGDPITLDRTYLVSDGVNSTLVNQQVFIEDTEKPTITCQDVTVEVDENGQVDISSLEFLLAEVITGRDDNCGLIDELPVTGTLVFSCDDIDTENIRSVATKDKNGNVSDYCEFKVTVVDNIKPTLTCQDITVELDENGVFEITSADFLLAEVITGRDDNCGLVNMIPTLGSRIFTCDNVGIENIRGVATLDKNGNTSDYCNYQVTVIDPLAPTAICKDATVQLGADARGTLTADQINDNSTDNCGIVSMSVSPNTFDCSQVGIPQMVTLTVSDGTYEDDCTATVTVNGVLSLEIVLTKDETCDGVNDGEIEILATGLNVPEYSIDGGVTFELEAVFTGLAPGEYDIVIRDYYYPACTLTTSATIAPGPVCNITPADPCTCLNKASAHDLDTGTGGGDGQFSEVAVISGDTPLPAGATFKVIAPTTGVYDVYNVPAEGVQSAGVPVATDGSVTFTYNNGIYELPFVHNDGEGYSMTVVLEVEGEDVLSFTLGNTCFYPIPVIESILDGPFCSLSKVVDLIGNAGGVAGTGTFYIDGNEVTVFDPTLYAPGTYTLTYEFDAGEALGYQLIGGLVVGSPAGAETLEAAENDPGCIATVVKSVEVIPDPEGYACREQVNVSLQDDCQATLTPESLVGDLECVDLSGYFAIQVEDLDETNGPVVDGCGRYRYTITGPDGFDCWGFVLAEDKAKPTLDDCPPAISGITKDYGFQPFLCDDITELLFSKPITYTADRDGNIYFDDIPAGVKDILDITGYAKFVDNCGDLTITVSDEVVYGFDPDCDDVKIVRKFTAVDACKGLASADVCYQDIIFTKPGLKDVFCPEDVELDCDDDFAVDSNGNPHPDETGYPWLYTAFDLTDDDTENYQAYLNQSFCNIGASYTDGSRIEICPGSYKIVRTWEVLDWCTKEVITCQQILKVGDNEAPVVSCPEVDYDQDGNLDLLSFSTGPYDCTAAFEVPMPSVTDNCSEWEVLTEIIGYTKDGPVVATIPPGQSRYISGIPLGCHFIRYTVTDACDQKTITYCSFLVEDRVAPFAVCDDDLNVSIGGQGLARVFASDIDEGSSDNCGPIRLEVRRRILHGEDYECLYMFDYDGDGVVIGDEVKMSAQFGDPDGDGTGQTFYYTPWSDFVDFTCCDMNQNVRIELRVWDDRNGDGQPGNEIEKTLCDQSTVDIRDNFNVCWMDLLVEDKLPAYCVAPLPADIDCDALPFDFDPNDVEQMNEMFGTAEGSDNCPGYNVEELEPLTDGLNDCGYGAFVRRFRVSDAKGQASTNQCEQVITVNERHHYKIKFPKDAEANCGIPQVDTLETEELACDLLAVSVEDQYFLASGDECYKIFRTYSVINWCEYDGNSDPVVVSRDEDCDGKPGDEDVWVIVETVNDPDPCHDYYGTEPGTYYSHVWYDRDNDPFNLTPKAETKGYNCEYETNPAGFWKEVYPITENESSDTDDYPDTYSGDHCDDMASTGYWQYTQVIKVYDNVNPVVTYTELEPFCSYSSDFENDCPGAVEIDFTIDENCTPEDLTIKLYLDAYADGVLDGEITDLLSGTYPNYKISGSFPLGAHEIGVSVEDGCGNAVGINIPFEVIDCKAPTPVCINGLAIELMPVFPAADADGDGDDDNGAMAIWASDFIASPMTDCSGEVTYSINRMGEEVDPDQTGITLTCDDDASLLVEIWAWDALGNGDYCETYVLVQDNMVNCAEGNAGGSIAGIIADEDLSTLAGVEVNLSGNSFQSMITPDDGHYEFTGLAYDFDYTVTPQLDKAPLNGVSTFDLVLMSKHVLGTQPLGSPYQMIAADVNNSKKITSLDAIQLRRLILNIDTKFANNASWRFVPRDYEFPDPTSPWTPAFPEVININDLQGALENQDFVAVKIGDLNGNSVTNLQEVESRSIAGRFLFQVEDTEMTAGESYRIDFRAGDLSAIQGYQMTLQLDTELASLQDMDYGIGKEWNFGTRLVREGFITTSWNYSGEEAAAYPADQVLFSLMVQAKRNSKISEVLTISNRLTVAEAYDSDDELLDVGIDFGTGQVEAAGIELYQNVPNPFRENTAIGFYLPEDAEVSFRIYDISGRTLQLIRGEFARGQNQIQLNRKDLGASGMLYYTMTVGDYTASRKMMVME